VLLASRHEYAILEHRLGHDLLQPVVLTPQVLDFGGGRLPGRVAQEPLLAGFEKLLAPPVVEIRRQALPPAERRNALLPAQPLKDNANLLFG
jgi:hypothetical protein